MMASSNFLPLCFCVVLFLLASAEGRGRRMETICRRFPSPKCSSGVEGTQNILGHTIEDAKRLYIGTLYPLVKTSCSQHLVPVLCGLYSPQCNQTEAPRLCRPLCSQIRSDCSRIMRKYGILWPESLACDNMPERGNCFLEGDDTVGLLQKKSRKPKMLSDRPAHPPRGRGRGLVNRCLPFRSEFCPNLPYDMAGFPNLLGHKDPRQVYSQITLLTPLMRSGCSHRLFDFLCGVHLPECNARKIVVPCRSLCMEVYLACRNDLVNLNMRWPERLQCYNFPENGNCFGKESGAIVVPPESLVGKPKSLNSGLHESQLGSVVRASSSSAADIMPVVKMFNGTFVHPFMEWLNSSTELNKEQYKLVAEQVGVAKLAEEKLKLEISQLQTEIDGEGEKTA